MVSAAEEDAITPLQILVQHLPSLPVHTQQQLYCKLLATSNSVRAAVSRHSTGKLSLRFSTYSLDRLKAFLPWLAKHGGLLASLGLELNLSNSCWHEAELGIGAALQQASSAAAASSAVCKGALYSAPGLQLQSYCSHPAVTGAALDQLDSWYLTRLELGRHASYSCSFALEQLTRLARLTLYEDSADALLPCLCSLTSLTRLALVDMSAGSISKLKAVPPQLLELQLSLARLKKSEELPPGLSLAHLTALTKLTNGDGKPLLVQAGDTLPPHLQHLGVRDVLDVTPLLPLSHLTFLSMCSSTTSAAQLQRVGDALIGSSSGSCSGSSTGSQLQSVSLCYGDMEAAAAAAGGWPSLPVDRLELRAAEGTLPAQTLDTLGRLPGLRRLEVYGGGCGGFAEGAVFEATQRQLAQAVAQMTSLEVLVLRGFGLLQDAAEPAAAGGGGGAVTPQASSDEPSDCSATTTFADDALCAHTSNLSLSSSYESTGSSSGSGGASAGAGGGGNKSTTISSSGSLRFRRAHSSLALNAGCGGSLQALMAAVASLPRLTCLTVSTVTCEGQALCIDVPAATDLAAASKLTSLQLVDDGLTDAAVNALVVGGLTGLRRLVLDNNIKVTADVLPDDLLRRLVGLRELGVLRTGIRVTAAAFKARMLQSHPHLLIKSSAR